MNKIVINKRMRSFFSASWLTTKGLTEMCSAPKELLTELRKKKEAELQLHR